MPLDVRRLVLRGVVIGVACLLASALEFWMCDSEWLAGVIMFKRIRVAEANEKLAKAITRAQSSLVSECQGILMQLLIGQSPTAADSRSPSTSAGRSRSSGLGVTGGKISLCCMLPVFYADVILFMAMWFHTSFH